MATLSKSQARGLFNFLGSHQKIPLLLTWTKLRVKAEEVKVDYSSFRQMRAEKVVPKRLGRFRSTNSDDTEPYTAKQQQAITELIKETSDRKEAAFARSAEAYATLSREVSSLRTERPSLMNELKAYCNGKVGKAKQEKLKKANHTLKSLIRESKWESAVRPGTVVDMSGGKLSQNERKLLSLGLKFSTGLNEQTALDVATAVNKFRYQHANDPRVPSLAFIRAAVIPHLESGRHATLPECYVKAFRSLQAKRHLTVISADKGGAVGVLLTTKYYALGLGV